MRGNTIFGQIVQLLSRQKFRRIVESYDGDKYTKRLDCWQQLLIMLFAQLRDLKSLREIQTAIRSCPERWEQIGVETAARSTVSDANAERSYHIYEDMFYRFLEQCNRNSPSHGFRLKMPVFTQDSTLVSLCLSAFPWAKYRKRKGAMKLHMLLDHDGCLPSFIRMTDGKCHDVNVVKNQRFDFPDLPPDSILTIDRGYTDYAWLYSVHAKGVVFVIRSKSNMAYRVLGQHKPVIKNRGIISDERIEFINFYEKASYPEELRLIRYHYTDKDGGEKEVAVITNNMELAASTIAALYKGRWEIETFFRWIKQNLKIKTFIGTSENAVLTQVWVAMILYLLLSFIKYQTRFTAPLSELLKILREVALETRSLIDYLRINWARFCEFKGRAEQLALF